jgi:hypothetical protein
MSLLAELKDAKAELECPADPWLAPLQRVRGKVEFDGQERLSSQTLLDMLEVPQRSRTAGTYRRLAKLMAALGWTAVRVRDLTRGGYKEQVRGYVRHARLYDRDQREAQDSHAGRLRLTAATERHSLQSSSISKR